MIDITLVAVGSLLAVLLAATSYAAYEYYTQLRKAQKEYEKARDTVENIVMSFNRELKREAEKIQTFSYKVELAASTADSGVSKAETVEKRVAPLENQIASIGSKIDTVSATMTSLSEAHTNTLEVIAGLDVNTVGAKVQDIEAAHETLKAKVIVLEEKIQKLATVTLPAMPQLETPLPVLPIKRDKALAALTETEVAVLEFLSAEGPKTAPEIKEKVQLSREHTARLMKRLYEEGYLERETAKLPFKYSVKKEMEKLLKKPEPSPV